MSDSVLDARQVPGKSTLETDLCVIGAGAAGIALAREWIGDARSVLLLESGGFEPDSRTQALCEGEATGTLLRKGDSYLMRSRMRLFGGTTHHWAGLCRPLEEIDFVQRPWVPFSGWPYPRSHLDPYYSRASELLEIASFEYEARDEPVAPSILASEEDIQTRMFHYSPPTRFGLRYRQELISAANIRVCLNGTAVELETNAEASHVTRVRVACLDGPAFWVSARCFVLAAGGIENPRLLLLSRKHQKSGLGNGNDLVGRFFMEHLFPFPGSMVLDADTQQLNTYRRSLADPIFGIRQGMLVTTPGYQRRHGLLNFAVDLFRETRSLEQAMPLQAEIAESLAAFSPGDEVDLAVGKGRGRRSQYMTRFLAIAENSPQRDSRVELSDEVDALGANKVRLRWKVAASDYRSIKISADRIATALGAASLGRASVSIQFEGGDLKPMPLSGYHHMGTTRMHDDPKQGVVDANGRVHGVSNLYVVGSSIFPTSGFANPTLTLVATTLMLSDYLKGKLAQ